MRYIINKRDYLETYGYLQTLKDIRKQKAQDVAEFKDKDLEMRLAMNYMQNCSQISAMQHKMNDEVEAVE